MTDKEKIKAEIERRLKEGKLYVYSRTEYEDLLKFIDSLEEPTSDDFEAFEKQYFEENEGEIVSVYDRHAGLVDGMRWKEQQVIFYGLDGRNPQHRTQEEIDEAMAELEEKIKAFTKAHSKEDVEQFLRELEGKEHISDLEEEINNYIGHPQEADEDIDITVIRQAARHFAQWGIDHVMTLRKMIDKDVEKMAWAYAAWAACGDESDLMVVSAFEEGAKWQKEQIMKDAVDLVIKDASFVNLKIDGIKKDDKVKLIIIKEE